MSRQVNALTVHQWLPEWEEVEFSETRHRSRPSENFFVFSMEAIELRKLCGIQRRSISDGQSRSKDLGIQRKHELDRSLEISRFVKHGFPWSSLGEQRRTDPKFADLKMPGWLPSAVIVNILKPGEKRNNEPLEVSNEVSITDNENGTATLVVPDVQDSDWELSGTAPMEIIDGQHRLFAFDDAETDMTSHKNFELPVVAFYGLDRSWQAYIFYTVNIKPKRINTSLAFDLYPLLRREDWLDRFEGHQIYRESRAQELTEALWAYPESPWCNRINMLGERGTRMVSQASWVRNLQATLIKNWDGRGIQIGGLFGASTGEDELVLPWGRVQQAAFLIYAWTQLDHSIETLKQDPKNVEFPILDIRNKDSMLNSDMGVRGFLYMLNDLCYTRYDELELQYWQLDGFSSTMTNEEIESAIESLSKQRVGKFIESMADLLASYDWRASKAEGLERHERESKARFRGSTGYRELREDLFRFLAEDRRSALGTVAVDAMKTLGYAS